MWIVFAFGSAFFAGITSILAKCGIKTVDSNVATAVRTVVVLVFSWLMVLVTGSFSGIYAIDAKTLLFLILSGLATGASWLCYFRALSLGDVNKVVPVDKASVVLTVILAFIIFKESVNAFKWAGLALIAAGTYLMIEKKKTDPDKKTDARWLIYAVFSAVFAALTSIFGKLGVTGIDSNLGTAIRTCVVLVMAWVVVFVSGKGKSAKSIPKKELVFIVLSGIATGASWLCYYRALSTGPASAVVPIDKLSILPTVLFSYIVFKERLSIKGGAGLVMIVAGTLLMLIK